MKKMKFPLLALFMTLSLNLSSQVGYIGEIRMFAGNFAPAGWASCEGQLLPVSQYDALFSILGTTYGGDGINTFALPDLRGRSAVGVGYGPGLSSISDGEKGGVEQVFITTNQLPSHTHTGYINIADGQGDKDSTNNDYLPQNSLIEYQQYKDAGGANFTSGDKLEGVVINNTGGSQGVHVRNPYLGIRYIICLVGVYPSPD